MKKRSLLLLFPFLMLTACGTNSDNESINNNSNSSETHTETGGGTQTGGNETQGSGTETGGGEITPSGRKDYEYDVPTNTPYSLNDYETFDFHYGREPEYHKDWNFYYGDSFEPNGQLWTNPNEKSTNSGIEFMKNAFIVSPLFESWTKVEIRFNFWFSNHQSNKYSAIKNQPQFLLECYDSNEKKLETISIEIERDDVPSNNTCLQVKEYIKQPQCNHFILRWNNYVPNSQGGYSAILVSSTLKGWQYE